MILICPDCDARFVVKPEAVGKDGRKVKCAKCSHVWFQKPQEASQSPDNISPEPTEKEEIPEGGNVPAVQSNKKFVPYMFLSGGLSVVFVLVLMITGGVSFVHSLFGLQNVSGFVIYDPLIETVEDENEKSYRDLVIKAVIVNESEVAKHIPRLRITMLDKSGAILRQKTVDSDGVKLSPGESFDFEDKMYRVSNYASDVVLDIGNSLDLASR